MVNMEMMLEILSMFYMGVPLNQIILKNMLMTIIFITCFLTGLGIYDVIGAWGGAGSVIPITGFSNSISSPSIEFKKEGIIYGICVKMFTIAGPVIVCGVVGSIICGAVSLII